MVDVLTLEQRRRCMAGVGSKNTTPEIVVRRVLYALGYRFRLHRKDLPGNPDIVLPKKKTVIFVHGCFWHGHRGCKRADRPTSNVSFWNSKLDRNIDRDKRVQRQLRELGWHSAVIWECQTRRPGLDQRLQKLFRRAK
jgi:DNA mismatch endonuclease (patch repair protein)